MMTTVRPQDTSPLFGLNQVFELQPCWGSPLFDEDYMLDLSNHGQTVRIRLGFADSSEVLLGRVSSHPTDDLNTLTSRSDSENMASLTTTDQNISHLVSTDEDRARAESLRYATMPVVDLQPFSADVFGVSRKHVVLEKTDRHIVLTGLNSTNGTRLNGTLLFPLQRKIIRNGDALQLGALQLRVRFRKAALGN